MNANCATAAISQDVLEAAAQAAADLYQKTFDDDCAKGRANYAGKLQGMWWWKRLPTPEEVEAWFHRSDWNDLGGMCGGYHLDSSIRLARAERLLKLGQTQGIADIRLPEGDIQFLKPFLNNPTKD